MLTQDQTQIVEQAPVVCSSSPSSDYVGMPCSFCGHAGHWLMPCQGCQIDVRLTELDQLIARYKALLAEHGA